MCSVIDRIAIEILQQLSLEIMYQTTQQVRDVNIVHSKISLHLHRFDKM
jgi:hypothetical protein